MSRNLSTNAKAAIFAQNTEEAFITLITINHDSFTTPIYIASDPFELLPVAGVRGVISNGIEYVYFPFQLELPAQDDTGIARARISIDNVDRQIVLAVRQANSALSISFQIVLSSDPDTAEVVVNDFRLDRVVYDALTVSGEISVEFYDLEPFPSKRFTPSDFPGIY